MAMASRYPSHSGLPPPRIPERFEGSRPVRAKRRSSHRRSVLQRRARAGASGGSAVEVMGGGGVDVGGEVAGAPVGRSSPLMRPEGGNPTGSNGASWRHAGPVTSGPARIAARAPLSPDAEPASPYRSGDFGGEIK